MECLCADIRQTNDPTAFILAHRSWPSDGIPSADAMEPTLAKIFRLIEDSTVDQPRNSIETNALDFRFIRLGSQKHVDNSEIFGTLENLAKKSHLSKPFIVRWNSDGELIIGGEAPINSNSVTANPTSGKINQRADSDPPLVTEHFNTYDLSWSSLREYLSIIFPGREFAEQKERDGDQVFYTFTLPRRLTPEERDQIWSLRAYLGDNSRLSEDSTIPLAMPVI